MPVSGLVSQGGQNIALEASCQYGQIFEMTELNNNDCDYKVSFRGMIQKYKFIKERNNNESGYEVGFRSIIRKYEPLLHIASSAQTISGQEGHKRKLLWKGKFKEVAQLSNLSNLLSRAPITIKRSDEIGCVIHILHYRLSLSVYINSSSADVQAMTNRARQYRIVYTWRL